MSESEVAPPPGVEAESAREERVEALQDPAPNTGDDDSAAAAAAAAEEEEEEEEGEGQGAGDAAAAAGPQGAIGVELGTDKCVVAASCVRRAATAVLVRNDVSNEATPTVVGFKGPERFVGEEALSQYARNTANTVTALPALLGATVAPAGASFSMEGGAVSVDYALGADEGPASFEPELLMAMMLRKLAQESAVSRTIADSFGADIAQSGYSLTLAVPSYFTPQQCAAAADAATIGSLPSATIVPCHVALAAQYTCRHAKDLVQLTPSKDDTPGDCRTILFVDCGAAQLTASVCDFTVESVVGGMVIKTRPKGTVRSVVSDPTCGSGEIDRAIFAHLAAECQEKHNEMPELGTRRGVRLLTQCEKAKKVLSSVAETGIVCENLVADTDVSFKLQRSTVEGLCASLTERMHDAVASAISSAGVTPDAIHAVELVGGGVRAPMVQQAIARAAGSAGSKLGFTLDSASATAVGAACYGAGLSGIEITDTTREAFVAGSEAAPGLGEEQLLKLTQREQAMADQTAAQEALGAARSQLEGFIYEFRNALDCSEHKALLDREKISPMLDSAEDWLYSEAADSAQLDDFRTKFDEVKSSIEAEAGDYFAKVAEEKAKMEAELKAAEAERIAEEAINGDSSVDTKLPYKQRMHKVEINKKEGNELVKDQNWSQGVARYTNALQHCSKFYDLSPEQMEELKAVKLSLYNNIAMCANKMEDWKVTKENCNKALEIDASNVKALFRRAAAFEKCKQYEEALADLATAASHAPEDKNVIKAVARVKKLQKKQEDKEKKMYGKMFG